MRRPLRDIKRQASRVRRERDPRANAKRFRRCAVGTEVQTLLFPRKRFTSASARAWASLHGFNHTKVDTTDRFHRVRHHNPGMFRPGSFRTILVSPREGVEAVIGCPKKKTEGHSVYERYNRKLRRRALAGERSTRRAKDPQHRGNEDLVRWYLRWYRDTHPGDAADERRVAAGIVRGLRRERRSHALDFVRKLGYRG